MTYLPSFMLSGKPGLVQVAGFYSARSETIPPLTWPNFAPPFPIVDAPTPFVFGSLWSFDPIPNKGRYQKYIDASKAMMDAFIEYASDLRLPLIAVGDFNMSLGHDALTKKAQDMQREMYVTWHNSGLRSAYHEEMRVELGEEQEATVFGKSQNGRWQFHVDYIWFDCNAFTLQSAKLHERQGSDHTPLTASFQYQHSSGVQIS